MSDDAGDLVKVGLGAGGGGALLLWLAQRVLGRALDKGEKATEEAEAKRTQQLEALQSTVHGLVNMESERKAQREELAAFRIALQDVSNKLSILLDRDSQQQRWRDTIDAHNRETDRQLGLLAAEQAGLKATLQQLREGGR